MLVCSELYSPELSRVLMLQGADIIAYPAGGAINELLPGWRTLVYARAIENLLFTVACQNLCQGTQVGHGTGGFRPVVQNLSLADADATASVIAFLDR